MTMSTSSNTGRPQVEPKIVYERKADRKPPMPGRRVAFLGALIGGILGFVFFSAYGGVSIWICTGIRDCPDHWVPYVVIPLSGLAASIPFGALAALAIHRIYAFFRIR